MKLEICKWLKRKGKEFYTNAIFKDNIGGDEIVNAGDLIIYEIFNKENVKSKLKKSKKYRKDFEIIYVDAN